MRLLRTCMILALFGLASCENSEEDDASAVFIDAAKALFNNKDTVNSIHGLASAFIQSNAGKQQMAGSSVDDQHNMDGIAQIAAGFGSLLNQGGGASMLGSLIDAFSNTNNNKKPFGDSNLRGEPDGASFQNLLNMGSMFFGRNGNSDILMGLAPMLFNALSGEGAGDGSRNDHSGHSWFMPPILEHVHVMWDHFSNSEFGQALWKTSGLSKIVQQMIDQQGNIQFEKMLNSFDNPALRRRWIKSLTNYVAEWVSHVSDPNVQQRYLSTAQFIGNSFLKTHGYPKSAMFDANRPTESLSRVINAIVRRHLGMKIDSFQYIKPAVSYTQELITLASEKGFIMSRVNAREIGNRLSDLINNDLIGPILKAYRAYKWAVKSPQCASQILCTINERNERENAALPIRQTLLKVSSFPVAWVVSSKLGMNFWVLYGAIMEHEGCVRKYPADCTAFHEEEIRVTTESVHNEL